MSATKTTTANLVSSARGRASISLFIPTGITYSERDDGNDAAAGAFLAPLAPKPQRRFTP
jgi:hypothetical protein